MNLTSPLRRALRNEVSFGMSNDAETFEDDKLRLARLSMDIGAKCKSPANSLAKDFCCFIDFAACHKKFFLFALIIAFFACVCSQQASVSTTGPFDAGQNWTAIVSVADGSEPLPGARIMVRINGLPPVSYYTDLNGAATIKYSPRIGDVLELRMSHDGKEFYSARYVTEKNAVFAVLEEYWILIVFVAGASIAALAIMRFLKMKKLRVQAAEIKKRLIEETVKIRTFLELQLRVLGRKKEDTKSHIKKKKAVPASMESLKQYQEKKLKMKQEYLKRFEE